MDESNNKSDYNIYENGENIFKEEYVNNNNLNINNISKNKTVNTNIT